MKAKADFRYVTHQIKNAELPWAACYRWRVRGKSGCTVHAQFKVRSDCWEFVALRNEYLSAAQAQRQ